MLIDEFISFLVLGVTRDSNREEIAKAYRALARKFHPDMHKGEENKRIATERFRVIATAYETLRDEESRRDYDYMLDNPDELYRHYYRYYRRVYAPKVDVRIVIVVTITVISVLQYWASLSRYNTAIDYLVTVPKYRIKAQEIAKNEGLLNTAADKKRNKHKTKEQIKEEEEGIIRKIVEEKMDIRGGYSKPSYKDMLWVQLILLPWTVIQYIIWFVRWTWKFTILKHPYGEEEKAYIMRKWMKLSQLQWDGLPDYEKEEFFAGELWTRENFDVWKQQKEEQMKAQLAESASYRRYRRYMKKGGPGQITFMDD